MSKNKKKKHKKISPVVIVLIIVFGIAFIVIEIFVIINLLNNETKETEYSVPSEYYVEYPDIEKYFNENTTVLEIVPVKESKDTYTEKDVMELLKNRGFTEYEVTTSYSIDGIYDDEKTVSDTSSDKHPIYETNYVTQKDELWSITVVDGTITASPILYVMQNPEKTPIMISETESIVSYDSSTNRYYKTIPNDNVIDVRVVDKIDAQTLESFNLEG